MSNVQLFDAAKITEIVELMGDELAMLVDTFAANGEEQISMMRTASAMRDRDDLGRAAHQLKGSAGNLGAVALHACCERVEQAAREADDRSTEQAVDAITELYEKTLSELQRMVED